MSGIERIAAERARQITRWGPSVGHDQEHGAGELAMAAVCYALPERWRALPVLNRTLFSHLWPGASLQRWDFTPSPDNRIRELEKAGALIAAEIDRLLAAAPPDDTKENASA